MELRPLFPTPIYWNEIDSQLADKVEEMFLDRLEKLPRHSIHSSDFHDEKKIIDIDKDLPDLKEAFYKNIESFCDMTGISVDPQMKFNAWTQDYCETADYHPVHKHGIHGVSGIYWIRANEHAGMTVFESPNPYTSIAKRHRETDVTHGLFALPPKKGTVVLFPAWLSHAVEPSKPGAIRSTMAFNLCD